MVNSTSTLQGMKTISSTRKEYSLLTIRSYLYTGGFVYLSSEDVKVKLEDLVKERKTPKEYCIEGGA